MDGLMMDFQLTLPPVLRRAEAYFPRKQIVTFDESAHAPHAQETSRFRNFMVATVLTEKRVGR